MILFGEGSGSREDWIEKAKACGDIKFSEAEQNWCVEDRYENEKFFADEKGESIKWE